MVEMINPMRARQQVQGIRSVQRKVEDRIRKIEEQLKRLESEPGTPRWVSFKRVKTVKELQSEGPPLRQALRQDLALLKSHLRDLQQNSARMAPQGAHRAASRSSQDFKKKLEEALKNAEKNGFLPQGDMAQLRNEAEEVVKKFVGILNGSATEKNIELVLDEIGTPLLLGSDIDSGVCGEAMRAVAHAAEKIVAKKDEEFRNNPTADNLDKLLQSHATAHLTGGQVQDKPANWQPVNTTHPVAPGDTLSAISEHYYGAQKFWDVIYFENYGVIGDDVRKLIVGTHLRIP